MKIDEKDVADVGTETLSYVALMMKEMAEAAGRPFVVYRLEHEDNQIVVYPLIGMSQDALEARYGPGTPCFMCHEPIQRETVIPFMMSIPPDPAQGRVQGVAVDEVHPRCYAKLMWNMERVGGTMIDPHVIESISRGRTRH